MKKIIVTFSLALYAIFGYAQAPVDFEVGGNGSEWNWLTFENDSNPAVEFVDNPDKSGSNTSDKVAKFTALTAGAPWAGTTGKGFTPIYFGEDVRVIKMMVWKSVISDVGIKLETQSGWAQSEVKVANTKTGEWEELTFVFTGRESAPSGEAFIGISVFPDFKDGRTQDNVVYFDNITFEGFSESSSGGGGGDPVAATYCDTEVTHFGIPTETPSAIKLSIYNVDASSMKIEITSANADPVDDLIVPGDITGSPAISGKDESVPGTIGVTITWNSTPPADVALNILWSKVSFAGNWQLSDQAVTVKFNGVCDGNSGGDGGGDEVVEVSPIDFESDGNGGDWKWEVFGSDTSPDLEIVANPDASGSNTSATVAKITVLGAGASWSGTSSAGIGAYAFDATSPIIKVMVWKSVISDVGVKLEAVGGWSQGEIKVANTKVNEWEELTFDFTGRTNPPLEVGGSFGKITFFPDFVEPRGQDNIIYFDNITFEGFNSLEGGSDGGDPNAPAKPALNPIHADSDVIAVFSDAYTELAGTDFNPGWGQATQYSLVEIEGNKTIRLGGLNYQGIAFAGNNDLSEKTFLHIDYWTANSTALNVSLISPGPLENPVALTVPATEWVSVDIPLTEFTAPKLTEIFQMKFDGNGDVYLDNIYFHSGKKDTTNEEEPNPNNLLVNGGFENGRAPWTDTSGEIRTEGENSFFFADIAQAGNPYDVNLSQVVSIQQGVTYILSFDASTGVGNTRTMLAGIGLNQDPWTPETREVTLTDQTQRFMLTLTATEFGGPNSRVLFDMGAQAGIVVIDNVSLEVKMDDNLLTNGDFELGRVSWTDTAGEIRTEGDNSFFFADIAQAGNAYDVNLSQVVAIQQGVTYELSFDASTGMGNTRTMLAGIGLNQDPWTPETRQVTLTDQMQKFTLILTATEFGGSNSRVLFDMGAEAGIVVIDNVVLKVKKDANLVVNGDFENGRAPWTETAGEIRTEGDNSFYFADVAVAGNAYDVNLAQVVGLAQGQKYTLIFDAATSAGATRTMIAGIGLNQDPWSSAIQTVTLTEEIKTYKLVLNANDFGGPNCRVLFDMGAETGVVVIDNVALVLGDAGTDPDDEGEGPSVFKSVDINFENDGMGNDFTWEVFENAGVSSLVVVDNPDKTGANTSDKVAAISISAAGARWAGAVTGDIDAFIPARDNSGALIVKMMVWKKTISNIEFKFETGFPIKAGGAIVANTKTEQWEEITFALRSPVMHPTELFRRMVIIPDFIADGTTREDNVVYFDNIRFSSYTPDYTVEDVVLPPTPAPVPTVTQSALSIFSDLFGNMGGANFNPDWTQATVASIRSIGEDSMLVYRYLNHQGIEIGKAVDVTGYTYLHLQLYTEDATAVNVSLISGSAEKPYSLPITQGKWVSYDIPVSHFSSNVVLTDVRHFKFDDAGSGKFPTVFVDNIYFTNELGTAVEKDAEIPTSLSLSQNYPNPFNPSTTISYTVANPADVKIEVFTIMGQRVATLVNEFKNSGTHTITFDASKLASGTYLYRLTSGSNSFSKFMMLIK